MNHQQENSEASEAPSMTGPGEYSPRRLLDALIERLKLKNDAALCRVLEVDPPVISKIRNGKLRVGASMFIRMHEETGLTIRELRDLLGDRRTKTRM